jgi:D-alanine--poly(phosphoribitol) ligase subunit 1
MIRVFKVSTQKGESVVTNVLSYLEHSAACTPDKTAVIDPEGSCTYARLMQSAQAVGSALSHCAVPRQPVVVWMEKSISALTAFFGIVYAGGFYVYISPDQPRSRLEQILSVAQPSVVISSAEGVKQWTEEGLPGKALCYDELVNAPVETERLNQIRRTSFDTDPLYCNFTSGSTGVPKGVAVCHRSVIDFIGVFPELFHITGEDVIANQAPFDFDVSVKDIYSAMKTGATLVLVPKKYFSVVTQLLDYLCEHQVTTLIWAVSALCLVAQFRGFTYRVPERVNKVLFSGEQMPIKFLRQWQEYLPNATYVNLYGPTEITCNCTYHVIDRAVEEGEILPIGRAFPNEKVFLLDADNRLITKPEVQGELCVAGTALALGYWNAPEQTAKAFVNNPLNPNYPERIYRTGDLAYYGENGELYFAGRKDFQIKHMGHRIELEEIEAAINRQDGVERCCCVYDHERSRLTAFYVGTPDPKELKKSLYALLPAYMIPNAMKQLPELPITANGKLDRKALLAEAGRKRHG